MQVALQLQGGLHRGGTKRDKAHRETALLALATPLASPIAPLGARRHHIPSRAPEEQTSLSKQPRHDAWPPRRANHATAAYTFAEVLVAILIVGLMAVSLFGCFFSGFAILQCGRENLRATQIMLQRIEAIRLFTWQQVLDTTNSKPWYSTARQSEVPCPSFPQNTERFAWGRRKLSPTLPGASENSRLTANSPPLACTSEPLNRR